MTTVSMRLWPCGCSSCCRCCLRRRCCIAMPILTMMTVTTMMMHCRCCPEWRMRNGSSGPDGERRWRNPPCWWHAASRSWATTSVLPLMRTAGRMTPMRKKSWSKTGSSAWDGGRTRTAASQPRSASAWRCHPAPQHRRRSGWILPGCFANGPSSPSSTSRTASAKLGLPLMLMLMNAMASSLLLPEPWATTVAPVLLLLLLLLPLWSSLTVSTRWAKLLLLPHPIWLRLLLCTSFALNYRRR
mmetsp:Transcript_26695/g.74771  ORF Transcript_26695/g.74771 Transcript_26695/m.74771 type:complete len:243 (-) Transcript_26695:462-1190(-)